MRIFRRPAFRVAYEAGYDGVCSAYGGYNFPGDDPFHLRRIHADPEFIRLQELADDRSTQVADATTTSIRAIIAPILNMTHAKAQRRKDNWSKPHKKPQSTRITERTDRAASAYTVISQFLRLLVLADFFRGSDL